MGKRVNDIPYESMKDNQGTNLTSGYVFPRVKIRREKMKLTSVGPHAFR
jgi:hypothetical protein